MARRGLRRCALALAAAALAGCGVWRPTTVPLATIRDAAQCPGRVDTLVVMLPGSYSRPQEFIDEGFVAALRERHVRADVVLVDAHVGYYSERSIVDRLKADVIAPARAQGYRQVWLVGISIGAFGALIYAESEPGGVDGIVAIGPYLGKRGIAEQVRAQGGLATWRAPAGPLDRDEIDAIVWRWLQPYARAMANAPVPAGRPPLYLGYGLDDRFRFNDDQLAAALPAGHAFTAPGGHDWGPWRAVWQGVLDAAPLPRDAACRAAR